MSDTDGESTSSQEQQDALPYSQQPSIAAKTLRPPGMMDDDSDESDDDSKSMDVEDEADVSMNASLESQDPPDSNAESESESQVSQVASVPVPRPRGKVLRKIPVDDIASDNDDDDDENDKSMDDNDEDALQVASIVGDEEEISDIETSIVEEEEETSIASPIKDVDACDKDVAVAEVVMEEHDSDASEVAAVVAEVVPKKVRKKPGPKPKNKDGTKKDTSTSKKRKMGTDEKKHGKKTSSGMNVVKELSVGSTLSREKLEAACKARDVLLSSLKETPFKVSESHVIHNFGRIIVENNPTTEPLFSNPTALYPVGFSCDRYEFSPVHGRIIKLRCEILDGRQIKIDEKADVAQNATELGKKYEGPYFRITWGQGIDELEDGKPFPFDLYTSSAAIGNDVDTVAVPMGLDVPIIPETGMRVKVRFEDGLWCRGTIKKATKKTQIQESKDKKVGKNVSKNKNKDNFTISIAYDDGMKEDICFPDPDVMLIAPGSEGIDDGRTIHVSDVQGKPVTSVYGKSPMEAWANAMIKMGMIDEIMYEKALESIEVARLEGIREAKEKLEILKRQRHEAKARYIQKQKGILDLPSVEEVKVVDNSDNVQKEIIVKEPISEEETALRLKLENVLSRYNTVHKNSQKISMALADARIEALGQFLSNPFYGDEVQQKTWLATIIKKEKSRMGSTGNRRKVVTPTDILDRNATFYNSEIEHLLEGLPGTEFCDDYVFYDLRASGASQYSVIHEVKMRKENEKEEKKKKPDKKKGKEKQKQKQKEPEKVKEIEKQKEKQKEKEAIDLAEVERERKRKAKEDEREVRKKQRLEELDQLKKARQEERLSRLSVQVDERLFKEVCFQRERVVLLASKLCGKEVSRRKKVSETVAAYKVENAKPYVENDGPDYYELPPLYDEFDLDIVRLHDFLSTFRSYFQDQGVLKMIPSLYELQTAVDAFSSKATSTEEMNNALSMLNAIGVALCRPLIAPLIKTLSSALATSLQEKNVDDISVQSDSIEQSSSDPESFLLTNCTWREIARLFLLMDALNEQGLTKVEQAHVLRGYRSGGHPNSKEAKRIRRGEDSELVLRRQAMVINADSKFGGNATSGNIVSVSVPCKPSVTQSDWTFYIHNIRALPSNAASGMKSNLQKSLKILKASTEASTRMNFVSKLEKNIALLDEIGKTYTSSSETIEVCKKVRKSVLRLLDKASGEIFSMSESSSTVSKDMSEIIDRSNADSAVKFNLAIKPRRVRGGVTLDLEMSEQEYKRYVQDKEAYISAAIMFKEEQERKKKRINADDDDDEDEDEEEEDDGVCVKEEKEIMSDSAEQSKSHDEDDAKHEDLFKKTAFDDFCADEPKAPELLRRCLAVLRNLCQSSSAETFLYPVDPQTNLRYYESVVTPMSLFDVGKYLQGACKQSYTNESDIEAVVAVFARKVRLVGKNVSCFSPVGGSLISTAEELLRIFERLLFDWILAPSHLLPPLEELDDDRCVHYHTSDDESMVLLCDGCEGKYNMSRLTPPLRSVPKGDWYCPRCRSGYCWSLVDPRIGKRVKKMFQTDDGTVEVDGRISECHVRVPDDGSKRSLNYVVNYDGGFQEIWCLEDVNNALKLAGDEVESIKCLEAITESPGYGCGTDSRLYRDVVPIQLDPKISDSAAQRFISSSIFRDTVVSCAVLLVNDADGMTSHEWTRVLSLLMMKCMASDALQDVASKIENEAHSKISEKVADFVKTRAVEDALPALTEDETDKDNSSISITEINTSEDGLEQADEGMKERRRNTSATKAAKDRQKKRDSIFLAQIIKNQISPAVASLEEDKISVVIDSTLVANDYGINYPTLECPTLLCDFCGLSDISVGTPLVRFPNEQEWADRAQHIVTNRRSFLIADICSPDHDNHLSTNETTAKKAVIVSIKLEGEVVADDDDYQVDTSHQDVSRCSLVPRNVDGLQVELNSRVDSGPPVLAGSLSVHECCAQAAFKARRDRVMQKTKDQISEEVERMMGNLCGRTVAAGLDSHGRSYWKLESDPDSLFILDSKGTNRTRKVFKFSTPESIASVIIYLGGHKLSLELKKLFPNAADMIQTKEWSDRLLKRAFHVSHENSITEVEMDMNKTDRGASTRCFNAGEEVLIVSYPAGKIWDALIVAVGKNEENSSIVGYRVHYKEWSSRFDEWVSPSRVLEYNDENIEKQSSMQANTEMDLPDSLRGLKAFPFLCAPNRARGPVALPNFRQLLTMPPSASFEDKTLHELKAALLLIESSLPRGSVKVVWKPHTSLFWRSMVTKSTTPGNLMGCLVLLENAISKELFNPNGEHLISCLPRHWKMINDASVSSISLRLNTLDGAIKYSVVRNDSRSWEKNED